jgi:hypothetical protein
MARTVQGDQGRPALNMWDGWHEETDVTEKDPRVAAFLELTEFLFQRLPAEHRDLPLKLIAYKAQHPMDKIPLALVLIGDQGCGKSLWGECIAAAFDPYSISLDSKEFGAEFQNWMEKSVFAVIEEAEKAHIDQYGEALKALISSLKKNMNDKFRPKRQIESYTMYMLTANDRAVGSFAADDRRMVVISCPEKRAGWDMYTYLGRRYGTWHKENGPKALLGYLLEYDLKGWRPPAEPPMTAEKYMAYREGLSSVQSLAEEMKLADTSRIYQWIAAAKAWAGEAETGANAHLAGQARAIAASADRMQVRDWYSPEELCLLFPNVMAVNLHSKFRQTTGPGELSRQLRNAGIPYLVNRDDPRGFKYAGIVRQFLIVANFAEWKEPMTQADFDRLMPQWPTFGALSARHRP